jgi:hypothetical protein
MKSRLMLAAALAALSLGGCHNPDEAPIATPATPVSEHVLEHLRPGGRVRPVIYTPPTDLTLRDPAAIQPPFPGPGTGEVEPPATVGREGPGTEEAQDTAGAPPTD